MVLPRTVSMSHADFAFSRTMSAYHTWFCVSPYRIHVSRWFCVFPYRVYVSRWSGAAPCTVFVSRAGPELPPVQCLCLALVLGCPRTVSVPVVSSVLTCRDDVTREVTGPQPAHVSPLRNAPSPAPCTSECPALQSPLFAFISLRHVQGTMCIPWKYAGA